MMEKLGRIFLFGIAYVVMIAGMGFGIWLLCRIVRAILELTRSPRERKHTRQARKHPLRELSLRAKAAWLICCLEEALLADGIEPYPDDEKECPWLYLLRVLWEVDELPDIAILTTWLDRVGEMMPSTILSPNPGEPPALTGEGKKDFTVAYGLYTRAGYRMAYLGPLLELIWQLVGAYWDDQTAHPEDSLALLESAQQLLEDYGIPLPPQDRTDFLTKFRAVGPGEPFVGRQCSYFVGW